METTCLKHESIERNTSIIPQMKDRIDEIHSLLLGTYDKTGLITRITIVEKRTLFAMSIAYWTAGIVGASLVTAVMATILK